MISKQDFQLCYSKSFCWALTLWTWCNDRNKQNRSQLSSVVLIVMIILRMHYAFYIIDSYKEEMCYHASKFSPVPPDDIHQHCSGNPHIKSHCHIILVTQASKPFAVRIEGIMRFINYCQPPSLKHKLFENSQSFFVLFTAFLSTLGQTRLGTEVKVQLTIMWWSRIQVLHQKCSESVKYHYSCC